MWHPGDVSRSSVSLLQPETFAEPGSVRPPREVRLGGCISESRQGVLASHISCFWLRQMSSHQLHVGLFSLCACVFWNKADTTVIPRCLEDCGVQVGLGLPRASTDLLRCLEPLDLGLIRVNMSRQDALSRERPSSTRLLWELPG